jgi:hypothetical protein
MIGGMIGLGRRLPVWTTSLDHIDLELVRDLQ